MRCAHLRFHYNIAKRMLIYVAGFNLGLLMRNASESEHPAASMAAWPTRWRRAWRS
jgi:hypothetical protein